MPIPTSQIAPLDPLLQQPQSLGHLRIDNYLDVVSLTILVCRKMNISPVVGVTMFQVYDYILNFNQELVLVWNSPWKVTKILFILTRYLPFIDAGLTISHQFAPISGGRSCVGVYQATTWMFLTGIVVAESILTLRTWAVWGCTRGLAITLMLLFWAFAAVEFGSTGIFVKSMAVTPHPPGIPIEIIPPCSVAGNTYLIVIDWAAIAVYEAVTVPFHSIRHRCDP
ncbi:hypothetical protein BD779DRAFT_266999 [Infundibulicybe gibba]|nr:hypothetical protein BD779DRAFT_266999 [Infundibulicybe gibba]